MGTVEWLVCRAWLWERAEGTQGWDPIGISANKLKEPVGGGSMWQHRPLEEEASASEPAEQREGSSHKGRELGFGCRCPPAIWQRVEGPQNRPAVVLENGPL